MCISISTLSCDSNAVSVNFARFLGDYPKQKGYKLKLYQPTHYEKPLKNPQKYELDSIKQVDYMKLKKQGKDDNGDD